MQIAINALKLTKQYKLYASPKDRLKEALHPFKRVYHKEFAANSEISLSIARGEVVGVIGKNGSGKSTLLKIITGVLTPSSGSIEVNGKITAMLELGAGFNPELTGVDNLYLSGSISGFSVKEMEGKIEDIVAFADIGEFIHQPLKTYSSGMKARLGFAFAIHSEPEILIIDEALSVGDVAFQRKCYAKIEDMCQSSEITVLFVSHSGTVIKQLCNRAIMLQNGKKVIDGNPKDVINLYEKFGDAKESEIPKIQHEFREIKKNKTMNVENSINQVFYDPNFQSKSLVKYPSNGAEIFDIKLLDSSNNVVNILQYNKVYTYSYKIKYFDTFSDVKIAMQLKNISGVNIGGKVVALKDYKIDKTENNKVLNIQWKFRNILNSGTYLLNSGTSNHEYGEKQILHRVIDAYIFKVINEKNTINGMVDFDFEPSIQN
jgi:lipopolysaccharide transport system ATP-binding protein